MMPPEQSGALWRAGVGLRLLQRGESVPDRKLDQAWQMGDVQLAHQPAAIGVYGFR